MATRATAMLIISALCDCKTSILDRFSEYPIKQTLNPIALNVNFFFYFLAGNKMPTLESVFHVLTIHCLFDFFFFFFFFFLKNCIF